LLTSGAPWLEMLAVLRVERAETAVFQSVFTEAMRRLAALQGRDEVRWHDCLRVLLTYASWRRPAAERETLKDLAAMANLTRKEKVRDMVQTIAEELIEQGRAEGELKNARDILRRLLLRKFQQLPDAVLQRIEACVDVERLKTALEHILDWKSVDEFDL
jgi:hypothetical protein